VNIAGSPVVAATCRPVRFAPDPRHTAAASVRAGRSSLNGAAPALPQDHRQDSRILSMTSNYDLSLSAIDILPQI
jgi:hypothetical protein